jgi:hypothetical protein
MFYRFALSLFCEVFLFRLFSEKRDANQAKRFSNWLPVSLVLLNHETEITHFAKTLSTIPLNPSQL